MNSQIQKPKVFSEGDAVIIYEDITSKKLVFLSKGVKIQNKYGNFSHDQIIGSQSGTKIFSKNQAHFIIILAPSSILITETLAHKTQILYDMDISVILMKLDILPGSFVIESGTGSGSLSYSISNLIQEKGHLFTFEFNKERHENAEFIFKKLKKDNITVILRDSCGKGFLPESEDHYILPKIDAVFLDLPRPWEAVPHARKILRNGGKICCFSPCIEQVQKTHEALRNNGFMEMEMMESLCRNFEKKERVIAEIYEKSEKKPLEEEIGEIGEIEEKSNEKLEEKSNENITEKPIEKIIEEKLTEKFIEEKKPFEEKKLNNKRKRTTEKKKEIRKAYFSTGQVVAKGHTGYLTFATVFAE